MDRRCHASVMRALPLAGARIRAWSHLDYDHLERLLSSLPPDAPQPVVMAESLYSMDGAALDLERMAALRRRYGFFLCVDEAHALGALGPGGRGLCAAQALRDGGRAPADLVVGTLGKSLGLWGAFLLLPRGFTPLFEHLASAIMHSTALPPAHAACMLALVEELPRLEERRRTLAARVAFFRQALTGRGLPVMGDAHILSVPVGDETRCRRLASRLAGEGVLVLGARWPTVPRGQALLRFGLTARHTEELLARTAEVLSGLWEG